VSLIDRASLPSSGQHTTAMRQCMELEKEQQWLGLADYLIKYFAIQIAACLLIACTILMLWLSLWSKSFEVSHRSASWTLNVITHSLTHRCGEWMHMYQNDVGHAGAVHACYLPWRRSHTDPGCQTAAARCQTCDAVKDEWLDCTGLARSLKRTG
jgi:hypothetical protein